MNIESLINELLLDLFEYLSIGDLFRAFNDLNARFNTLIFHFIRCSRHVDCRSMSKNHFDFLCQEHFAFIANHIISLSLSNSDENPQQIDRLFSCGLQFEQFIHLRSLSFDHLCSTEIMEKIMIAWMEFPYLTHLKFNECYFHYHENDVLQLINSIWSLPKLTHCHLNIMFRWQSTFLAPIIVSSSIESLIIEGIHCHTNELSHLFQHTIRLRHLYAIVDSNINSTPVLLSTSLIISLGLKFCSVSIGLNSIKNLLEHMCNLRRLTIETLDLFIDGEQWKDIIVNYLPKLKVFQLKMEFYFRDRVNTKQYVDQLFKSFQTDFWCEEHQWFVRCHYHPQSNSNYVCFYTLPYSFVSFPRIEVSGCQSTCPDDNDQHWSYDKVHTLNCRVSTMEDSIPYQSRFVNIKHLSLSLDANNQFRIIVPRFIRLISLEISLHGHGDNVQFQIQSILDQALHLNFLKFGLWTTQEIPIAKMTSSSVRQLDLRKSDRWYNVFECLTLINSPLGIQCEFLRINVVNRMNILDLVSRMTNLRALNVRCEGDAYNEQLTPSNDELVKWLQDHLPSTCNILRNPRYIFDVLLWIR